MISSALLTPFATPMTRHTRILPIPLLSSIPLLACKTELTDYHFCISDSLLRERPSDRSYYLLAQIRTRTIQPAMVQAAWALMTTLPLLRQVPR